MANPYLCLRCTDDGGPGRRGKQDPPGQKPPPRTSTICPEDRCQDPDRTCHSLDQSPGIPGQGRAFLTKGGVFTDAFLDAYIELKMHEVTPLPHDDPPVEFDMYYSL